MNTSNRIARPYNGFTLLEVMIASSIALILGLVAMSFFKLIRQASVETTGSYLISRDLEEAVKVLRNDLRQTALASVRIYSNPSGPVPPSLTCVTAQDAGTGIHLNEDGQPEWTGWVTYRLEAGKSGAASLIRTVTPRKGAIPDVAPMPNIGPAVGDSKVLLNQLAPPNSSIEVEGGTNISTGLTGGFSASFVRLDGSNSYKNSKWSPVEVTSGAEPSLSQTGNTGLIEVKLALLQNAGTADASYIEIPVRVAPRY
jgi:prepilin-type N-terminal cleavage/methylation domain-containing protein